MNQDMLEEETGISCSGGTNVEIVLAIFLRWRIMFAAPVLRATRRYRNQLYELHLGAFNPLFMPLDYSYRSQGDRRRTLTPLWYGNLSPGAGDRSFAQ